MVTGRMRLADLSRSSALVIELVDPGLDRLDHRGLDRLDHRAGSNLLL